MNVAILFVTALLGAPANFPDTIDVDTVKRLANDSARVEVLRARTANAVADLDVAGVLDNPELVYGGYARFVGDQNAINGTQHQVQVDVPLPIFGTPWARRDAAKATAAAVAIDVARDVATHIADAVSAFAVVQANTARVVALQQADVDLERTRALLQGRVVAGVASAFDGERVEIEQRRLRARVQAAVGQRQQAHAVLAALLGAPSTWQPTLSPLQPLDVHPTTTTASFAIEVARAQVLAARADRDRAERERLPTPTLSLGTYLTTDGNSTSGYGALSLPLPVLDTGDAVIRAARAREHEAEAALSAITTSTAATHTGAIATWTALREQVTALQALRARLDTLRAMAESAWRTGAAGAFELIDAHRTCAEARLEEIDATAALVDAEVALLLLEGRTRQTYPD